MKISYKIFLLFASALLISSCEEDDVFTGSPVGTNVQFETINGTVATTETSVVSGQSIPIMVTLERSFPVETNVQVMAFIPSTNKRTLKTVVIPAGATSSDTDEKMNVPGAELSDLPFHLPLELSLVAITTGDEVLPVGFSGKQYTLTSPKVILDYGDSAIPVLNANRFIVRLDWEFPPNGSPISGTNNFNLVLKKNGTPITITSNSTTPIFGLLGVLLPNPTNVRYRTINFNNALADDATYTLEVYAQRLVATPSNIDFRFVARFPEDITKVYPGTLTGITVTPPSGAVAKLQIVKTSPGGVAHYDVTQL